MNGIVPVVIVIGILTVPAAVMRLKRVMSSERRYPRSLQQYFGPVNLMPYLGRMRIIDARFDRIGSLKMRALVDCLRLRK